VSALAARLGADDEHLFETPRPVLVREITDLEPEPSLVHVRLDNHGVRSLATTSFHRVR
jgi:hypothetical protein